MTNAYCSYSDGFRVGVFAIVFSFIQTVAFVFWVPHTGGNASYGFKSDAGESESTGAAAPPAPLFASSATDAYQTIGPSGSA